MQYGKNTVFCVFRETSKVKAGQQSDSVGLLRDCALLYLTEHPLYFSAQVAGERGQSAEPATLLYFGLGLHGDRAGICRHLQQEATQQLGHLLPVPSVLNGALRILRPLVQPFRQPTQGGPARLQVPGHRHAQVGVTADDGSD